MSVWTSGYVSDLDYTYGFYRDLTPALLGLVPLVTGKAGLDPSSPLTYCELACGQGFSANLLAAANPHIRFYATDFNPSHIAGARRLADRAKLENICFYDTPFATFAAEPDLPTHFDIIVMHGLYSWIDDETRRHVIDFLSRRVKVGGLAYVSYNCQPGWAAAAPMRHLLHLHGRSRGGPTISRIEPAVGFVERLIKAEAAYFRAAPGLARRFDNLKKQNPIYLAHEYLNDNWRLFYHSDVAAEMSAAKLSYLASAYLIDHFDTMHLTAEQREIVNEIGDPTLRETVRDFMRNRQFRRDVYIRGPLPLGPRARQEAWLDLRFALSVRRQDIELRVMGSLGEMSLRQDFYGPVLDQFAAGPKLVRDLLADPAVADLGWPRLQETLTVLVGGGWLQPCLPEHDDGRRMSATTAFNQAVMQHAIDSADLRYLASPVTGGGVPVSPTQQLFLLARDQGCAEPDEWAKFHVDALAARHRVSGTEGPETHVENLAELTSAARRFAEDYLPVLRSLKVVA